LRKSKQKRKETIWYQKKEGMEEHFNEKPIKTNKNN
jgi:hypothetical protein